MGTLFLDTETRSGTKITQGTFRYCEDENFDVLLVTWAINDSAVECWQPMSEEMPAALHHALNSEDFIYVIHNSPFDRRVIRYKWGMDLPTARIHDTMVQALAHGLPGGLGQLSGIFKLGDSAKMDEGKDLIRYFCQPVMTRKNPGAITFHSPQDAPEKWNTFCQYAMRDVQAMRLLYRKMPRLNYPDGKEHLIWQYDQAMNDRGLLVDLEMAEGAIEISATVKKALKERASELTGGEVDSASRTAAFRDYLNGAMGANLPDLRMATLTRVMENPDTDANLREALTVRIEMSRNAAAKYKRLLGCADSNGRLHDTIQFLGASRTGRDAGRIFQPQNLPRTTMWGEYEGEELIKAIESDIESTKARALDLIYPKPLDVLGNLLRSVIYAPRGSRFCVADLSNIEGRSLVWLANEDWKVKYFRDYDAGSIEFDNYVAAYAKAMNVDPAEVGKYERQIGKVMELGLGYGGGVSAFLTFAAVYRLDISALAKAVRETAEPIAWKEAADKYEWAKENGYHAKLEELEYTACEYLKTQWRLAHPRVVRFWRGLEKAFRDALDYPNTVITVDGSDGKIKVCAKKGWLLMRLPSGRFLTYFSPRVEGDGQLTFMGVDGLTKRFQRIKTYSGKLAENATSATARDVMFHRIPDIEADGFNIVMRVHDELVAECPDDDYYTHLRLAEHMSNPHSWCSDLPLAAAGFTGYRYRGKD